MKLNLTIKIIYYFLILFSYQTIKTNKVAHIALKSIAAYISFKINYALIESALNYHYSEYPCTDQDALNAFDAIKKDLNVTENIHLYTHGNNRKNLGRYSPKMFMLENRSIILLNEKLLKDKLYRLFVYVAAHEVGHSLQFTNHKSAYTTNSLKSFLPQESKKLEIGADATAAGYQCCAHCLKHLQKKYGLDHNSAQHEKGYFAKEDFQPYIDRAVEHNWMCPAHADYYADPRKQAQFPEDEIEQHYDLPYFLPKTDILKQS